MPVTATALRQDIYRILDQVLETGVPVDIERKGQILHLVADKPRSRLANLVRRECITGDPEDIVYVDWTEEWKP